MNEIALSNDIARIETEIGFYKNQAGQSIWEIGRRLNHVKENDLAHGEFMDWLQKIDIDQTTANKMMKVSKELPNYATSLNLGTEVMYLIATLPEEEKQEELQKAEEGEPSTVRELRELKKQLKEKDEEIDEAYSLLVDRDQKLESARRSEEIAIKQLEDYEDKPPETIIQEVEVEPDDYLALKNYKTEAEHKIAEQKRYIAQLKHMQEKEDENSKKYEELNEAIQEMEGKMNKTQKLIQSQKQVYELVDESKDLLQKIVPIPYLVDAEYVNQNPVAKRELENLADQVGRFLDHLNEVLEETEIIEGEIIDD